MRARLISATNYFYVIFFLLLTLHSSSAADDQPISFETVKNFSDLTTLARDLASQSFEAPDNSSAKKLSELSYDDYRMIRFNPDHALWKGQSLFEAQFFHPGSIFNVPVAIYEIDQDKTRKVEYSRELFNIEKTVADKIPLSNDYNYAGLKLTYPLHKAEVHDDFAVFLGASYFRLVGRQDNFGISARGLAIDTAEARGEEFPYFSHFWLMKPQKDDSKITVLALLNSQSLSGAYLFSIQPGQSTIVDCTVKLFFRSTDHKFGIAPLTSMFLYGETLSKHRHDFRPEIHDSDGLLMLTGSNHERLFRPLTNPTEGVRTTRFIDIDPKGFGLIQRDRFYENYLDLETHYETRPDLWVETIGQWGSGAVELVEISSEFETNDNVVAYWVPDNNNQTEQTFSYRLINGRNSIENEKAKVIRTLVQPAQVEQGIDPERLISQRFLIDFKGAELAALASDQDIHPDIRVENASFKELTIVKDDRTGDWRVSFLATREKDTAVDMRLSLSLHGELLSESWLYLWDQKSQTIP